jgi:hypothetical protein
MSRSYPGTNAFLTLTASPWARVFSEIAVTLRPGPGAHIAGQD